MAAIDTTQQKSLAALEPYLLLSKSATSPRTAADLITQATSAPSTFTFAELLETTAVQDLRNAELEYAQYHTLLQIFAWGTWGDYVAQQSSLPPLNASQSAKLHQLTLLTLCQNPSNLTYPSLLTSLSLSTSRDLEDLVITSIYANLLTATCNPASQSVDVSAIAPVRDPPPGSVPQMLSVLEEWDARCTSLVRELDAQIASVRSEAAMRKTQEDGLEKRVQKIAAEMPSQAQGSGLVGAGGGGVGGGGAGGGLGPGKRGMTVGEADEMDLDDRDGGEALAAARSAKRGGGNSFGSLGRRLGGD